MVDNLKLQVFLRGGLGNQLFQYATGLYLSEKFNKELVLRSDLLPSAEDKVGGVTRWPEQISSFCHSGTVLNRVHQPKNSTNLFSKYMQILRMIGDVSPSLPPRFNWLSTETKADFLPKKIGRIGVINSYSAFKEFAVENRDKLRDQVPKLFSPSDGFLSSLEKVKQQNPIIVHIRRGDYVGLERLYGHFDTDYYLEGIEHLRAQAQSEKTWIFSDAPRDISRRFLDRLGVDRVIGPEDIASPLENLVLMGSGSALLGANSSFSWWAGLISSEANPVVAPRFTSARFNNFSDFDEKMLGWKLVDII